MQNILIIFSIILILTINTTLLFFRRRRRDNEGDFVPHSIKNLEQVKIEQGKASSQ